jgi:ribosomal protein S16
MLRIRLRRVGGRGKPSYRVVVADKRAARDGAFVEIIAQPTITTARLLGKAGILEKYKLVKEKPKS